MPSLLCSSFILHPSSAIICRMLPALFQTMRPKQWTKNFLIFAALVFDHKLFESTAFALTLAGFWLLCMLSSAVYLINDLADMEKDRQHPKKRSRPLASGRLKPNVAIAAVVVLLAASLPLS